jgi:hypothetical protein
MSDEKVLILGDSIARHYFPFTEEFLAQHDVEGVLPTKWVSCQWKQMRTITQLLQGRRKYGGRKVKAETVHFNFGLHSIKLPNKGRDPEHQRVPQSDFDTYERELIEQIEQLRAMGIRTVLFSNTTPNPKNAGMRNDKDVVILNEIAKRIMEKYEVPHNDLYGFVKAQEDYPRLYMHPRSENNCHFRDPGRKLLGDNVAQFILDNM